jgi:Flp pilus assembly protein TadD
MHQNWRTSVAAAGLGLALIAGAYRFLISAESTEPPPSAAVSGKAAGPMVSLDEAVVLAASGRTEEAVAAFRELASQRPSDAVVLANLCGAELQAGRPVAAEAPCRNALRLVPASWLAHYNLACVLALTDRPEASLDSLEQALETVADSSGMTRAEMAQSATNDKMLASLHQHRRFRELTQIR